MIHAGNPVAVEPNVDIFMHMILLDWDHHLAMAFGDTVVVTPDGCETVPMNNLIGSQVGASGIGLPGGVFQS